MALKFLLSVNCYLKDFFDKNSQNPEAVHCYHSQRIRENVSGKNQSKNYFMLSFLSVGNKETILCTFWPGETASYLKFRACRSIKNQLWPMGRILVSCYSSVAQVSVLSGSARMVGSTSVKVTWAASLIPWLALLIWESHLCLPCWQQSIFWIGTCWL